MHFCDSSEEVYAKNCTEIMYSAYKFKNLVQPLTLQDQEKKIMKILLGRKDCMETLISD